MKKLIILTLTLMLVFSMTIPAFAATPKLEIPKIFIIKDKPIVLSLV